MIGLSGANGVALSLEALAEGGLTLVSQSGVSVDCCVCVSDAQSQPRKLVCVSMGSSWLGWRAVKLSGSIPKMSHYSSYLEHRRHWP